MSTLENVQTVKDFLAAVSRVDKPSLLALSDEDIEWVIPGEDWPLAGTYRRHEGLALLLQKASQIQTSFPEPPNFVAQGDRVIVIGFATGKVNATGKTFEDHFVFAVTVHTGRAKHIREYVDTQAFGKSLQKNESGSSRGKHRVAAIGQERTSSPPLFFMQKLPTGRQS
ncbi:nuclear transport factor 2 family protein [Pseudomonas sp. S2_H01]